MHIQASIKRVIRAKQDRSNEQFATADFIRSSQEEPKELELGDTQGQLLPPVEDLVVICMDLKLVNCK